jgi:hypothetical protein
MHEYSRENVLSKLLFLGPASISIFLISASVTDPVNAPKFFLLGVVAAGVLGATFYGLSRKELRSHFLSTSLLGIFVLISVGTLFTSNAPLTQSLYGVYGRNNGFLTYLFFSSIFLGALFASSSKTHLKMIYGLFVAGAVNIVYCGWVLAFGDFIGWNNPYGNILGTFGNPNFIGSFLGIFFSAWFAFLLGPQTSRNFKFASLVVLPLTALEIYLSHAIQGRVLMLGGAALVGFFWIRYKFHRKVLLVIYSFGAITGGAFALAGALQVGPLTSMIYKTSVSLRGQYWLSAWNTGQNHPFTGVGYDGLGDWYRRMRDARALELPGVNTVINTAHNVPLDLFAFGGWPLFLSYLGLVLLTLIEIIRHTLKMKTYDRVFIALTVAWVCYQLQSIISINQIGLGLWGWLLSGAIIGYVKINRLSSIPGTIEKPSDNRRSKKNSQVVSIGLVAGIAMLIGALVAVPPLASDMKWMSAQTSLDAAQVELSLKPGYLNPENTQKYYMLIQLFEQSNLTELAHKYALQAVKFNPDVYDSWRLLSLLKNSSAEEKNLALVNMKRLDPLNPELQSIK